jgi:hypothetical protein
MKTPEQIRAEAFAREREAADFLDRHGYLDPAAQSRVDAVERERAEQAETRRRRIEERRERRERDRQRAADDVAALEARVSALEAERPVMIDNILDTVGTAIGELLRREMEPIKAKLTELEALLNGLRSLSAAERGQPIDLPSPLRSLRSSRRDAN